MSVLRTTQCTLFVNLTALLSWLVVGVAPLFAQTLPNEDDPTGNFDGMVENLAIVNADDLRLMDVVISIDKAGHDPPAFAGLATKQQRIPEPCLLSEGRVFSANPA